MKNTLLLASAALVFCSFLLVPKKIDLFDAIDRGYISVEAISLGKSSSDCVQLNIRNLTNKDLEITVNTGLQLATESEYEQDILVTRPENILVKANETRSEELYGFCSQSLNATPGEDSVFKLAGYATGDRAELATYLADNRYDADIEQEAIWSITDGFTLAGIYSEDEEQTTALREFCSGITGEEIPWYNIDYGDVLDEPFVDEPVELNGEMEYKVDERALADLKMFAPDGTEMVTFFESRHMRPATYTQNFSFSAYGLARGDYTFVLYLDGEEHETAVVTL